MKTRFMRLLCVVAATAALSACGGGGGTDGTGAAQPSAAVTSSGAMLKGSVILNGVRFDDTQATVTDDRSRTAAQLADGMVVKLRGRTDDGVTGAAERVDVENEVRADITSIDPDARPQRFTVAGVGVLVDADTVFADVAGFSALALGMRVEVHGLRDAAGLLRATRVEAVGETEGVDELRGAIGNVDTAANQFTLNGNVTVRYGDNTSFSPPIGESGLAAGTLVEVRGSLAGDVFTATSIDFEDIEDAPFEGQRDEKQEVEGFVTGFTAHPGTFRVNGRTVRTTDATRFEDGTSADLANGVKVEAEGVVDAQDVLVAAKIEFKQTRVILHGLATNVNTQARTLVVLNQVVQADDLTRIDARASGGNSTALADIVTSSDCVEVRGFLDGDRIVAEEIKEPSSCSRDLVQARVTAENTASFAITFFGNLSATLPANAQFRDANDAAITRDQFLAAVTPAGTGQAGTLVKVKGTFAGGTLTTEEADLED